MKKAGKKRKAKIKNRPDVGERSRDSTMTLPMGVSKWNLGEDDGRLLVNALHPLVLEANQVAVEGSLLAQAHMVRAFDEGFEPPRPDLAYYLRCLRLVRAGVRDATLDGPEAIGLVETMHRLYPEQDRPAVHTHGHHGDILVYVAKTMATATEQYAVTGLFDCQVHYVRAKYAMELKGHAKFLAGRICRFDDPLDFEDDSMPARFPFVRARAEEIIVAEHTLFQEAFDAHKEDGVSLFRYIWQMLRSVEGAREVRVHMDKLFHVLPLRSMGLNFIDLDVVSIYY